MPAPRVLALVKRKLLHNEARHPAEPCYIIDHLDLDGVVLCPEGKKLHSPGFWARFRKKCRNLRDHGSGYVMHVECMWCRWAMDAWEKKHPVRIFPEITYVTPAVIRPDLNLYSPTQADLFRDGRQAAFLSEMRDEIAAS